jgi:hypothetical protein
VLAVLLLCLAVTFAAFAMVEALNRVLGVIGSDGQGLPRPAPMDP